MSSTAAPAAPARAANSTAEARTGLGRTPLHGQVETLPPLAGFLVRHWQLTAAVLMLLVLGVIDLGDHGGVPVAPFYVAPILLSLWSQKNSHTLFTTYAATALIVLGFLRQPLGGDHETEVVTRILSVALVWLAAALSLQRWRRELTLQRAVVEMRQRIHDRSDELTRANANLQTEIADRRAMEETLRQLSGHLLQAQDQERRRIARELHDNSGQTLAAIAVNLSRLENLAPDLPQKASNLIADTAAMAESTSREIRTLSYLLHPPLLEEAGLAAAVGWFANGFTQRSGIRTGVEVSSPFDRLPGDVEMTLFRIVQESLTNIARHSESRTAQIRLFRQQGEVVLEVRDEGRGIPREKLDRVHGNISGLGVGIAGIWERVRQLGGELEINSNSLGTAVLVVIPLAEETT